MDEFDPHGARWHEGELAVQRKAGVEEIMEPVAQLAIRRQMLAQHRQFFENLPFIAAASVSEDGTIWATIFSGKPGFIQCPTPTDITINIARDPTDPAWPGFAAGAPAGFLGIELHTRRRNRLNGKVSEADKDRVSVRVRESYGNCPQYIRTRKYYFARDPLLPSESMARISDAIDDQALDIIAAADTFFIASYAPDSTGSYQADVSHKAGRPGFVKVEGNTLTFPDFAGNLYFNTLGNIFVNPKVGLLFVDFGSGDILQVTGCATISFESSEISDFQGAERFVHIRPSKVVLRRAALPIRWSTEPDNFSPNVALTGSWEQAEDRRAATELASRWRPFKVAKIIDESATIRSLFLLPTDGAGLPPFQAGQHLPVRFRLGRDQQHVQRNYSLSAAPSDGIYRISVKRDGEGSQYLHALAEGDVLDARSPRGLFTIEAGISRPAVFLAGGIGVTPLLSMLRHIVYEGKRTRVFRPVWIVYASRTKGDRAFEREISSLASAAGGAIAVTRVLSDISGAEQNEYEIAGRITADIVKDAGPLEDIDFYLCGPASFMQDLYAGIRALEVDDENIYAESFGVSSLKRDSGRGPKAYPAPSPAPVEVQFVASGKSVTWTPGGKTLLELAEEYGLDPSSSCRSGSCGVCRTRVLAGDVTYEISPGATIGENNALICCGVPAAGAKIVRLDL